MQLPLNFIFENSEPLHRRNGIRVDLFDFLKNVTNLDSVKIHNIFFGDKKVNMEGCTAVQLFSVYFWPKHVHIGLEGTL